MGLTADDLTTPLGQNKRPLRRLPFGMPQLLLGLLGIALLGFLGVVLFNNNPLGGEPVAYVAIAPAPELAKAGPAVDAGRRAPEVASKSRAGSPNQQIVTIIDGSKGTRRDIVIGTADAPAAEANPEIPPVIAGIERKLLENSRYGMVPVVSGDMKASRVYAGGTDADRAKAAVMPAVAIVVTGLGMGAAKTSDAIAKLPGSVTLAFMPYGSEPGKLVERARARGHEILLQVPMEPVGYPDNDPGPKTLLTTSTSEQNLDRLLWHMSRFQGYVGLTNLMGARFLGTDAALQPVIEDAARRGLAFLDDGTAAKSVASSVADNQAMPFATADMTIDATPTAAEIDRSLAKLETLAKQRGVAIGVASGLAVSIDRIAAWAKALEGRGIILTPLTSAMLKARSS